MFGSCFKWLVLLVMVNGVLIEIDHAYKQAMSLPDIVMPTAPFLRLPEAFHNSPMAEHPLVHEFDGMTMTSGTIMWMGD